MMHCCRNATQLLFWSGINAQPCVSHLTEDEIRVYIVADNKLTENARSDHKLLALELKYRSIRKFQRGSSSTYDFVVTPQS
jgi:hypothetical protein